MKRNPEFSIVIPFYNEKKNIPLVLNAYQKIKNSSVHSFELICVNNGSTDGSETVFTRLLKNKKYSFARVTPVKKNKGYGYGIMSGVRRAKGDVIAWTHADMQTDAKDPFRAYEEYLRFQDKKFVIKGNRVKRPVSAFLFSLGMAIIASFYLNKWFYEINAQPKLFHRSFLPLLKNAPDDFSLDLYFLNQCKKNHYSIKTIPVYFHNRIHGESKWAFSFSSKWRTILRTIRYIQVLSKTK